MVGDYDQRRIGPRRRLPALEPREDPIPAFGQFLRRYRQACNAMERERQRRDQAERALFPQPGHPNPRGKPSRLRTIQ